MATALKRQDSFLKRVRAFISDTRVMPIMLTLTVIAILFVLFRMKTVELDYQISSVNKDIEKATLENKELKAKKANLLSIKRLRKLARKHKLSEPKQSQIIVVP